MSSARELFAPLPSELNPYAPPQERDFFRLPPLPRDRFGEVNIRVLDIERRIMRRRLQCSGTNDAELIYDAWGSCLIGECVYANKLLRARKLGFGWGWEYVAWVAPRVDFEIEWQGCRVPARFEAALRMTLFHGLRFQKFQLWIAERLVYDERELFAL